MHVYEIQPRKDKRGVNLISDALPFGRLWYGEVLPDSAKSLKNVIDACSHTRKFAESEADPKASLRERRTVKTANSYRFSISQSEWRTKRNNSLNQKMILRPRRVQGLKTNLPTNKKFELITEQGPGVFVCAHITKQGGSNDIGQVALYIDGKNVVAITYAAAGNVGLGEQNNSGIKLVKGFVDCISIQYNEPLYFKKECRIEISTGSDAGIAQVVANAVIGSNCSYPS